MNRSGMTGRRRRPTAETATRRNQPPSAPDLGLQRENEMGNDLVVAPPSLDGGMDVMTGQRPGTVRLFCRRSPGRAGRCQGVGREFGLGPIASMTGIHIISGKPAIGANLMAMAVKRSGKYTYKVVTLTDEVCRLEFYERNGDKWEQLRSSEFTRQDATKAGVKTLIGSLRNMLLPVLMSNGVRWYCPDALAMTAYTPEELDGELVIEVESSTPQNQYQAAWLPPLEPAPAGAGAVSGPMTPTHSPPGYGMRPKPPKMTVRATFPTVEGRHSRPRRKFVCWSSKAVPG